MASQATSALHARRIHLPPSGLLVAAALLLRTALLAAAHRLTEADARTVRDLLPPAGQGAIDDYPNSVLRDTQHAEISPVTFRILPREPRRDLAAVYDVARVIDDLGDESERGRTALLLRFREDLGHTRREGGPEEPVLRGLIPTIRTRSLELDPCHRLVRASPAEQEVN